MLLPEAKTYKELTERFSWQIPERFNIGVAICDAWADKEPRREALVYAEEGQPAHSYSYGTLKRLSNQLANLLKSRGIQQGDRIGILMPQRPETAFAHIAALKLARDFHPAVHPLWRRSPGIPAQGFWCQGRHYGRKWSGKTGKDPCQLARADNRLLRRWCAPWC